MATHVIPGLPRWHSCARMHGHDYRVQIRLETDGPLGVDGRVGGEALTDFERWVEETLHHKHLNEVLPDPDRAGVVDVAEWIVRTWRDRLPELVSVAVFETDRTHTRVTVDR